MFFAAGDSGTAGGPVASSESSTTASDGSKLWFIQAAVEKFLNEHVNSGGSLNVDLPTYASTLAELFYQQKESSSGSGTVHIYEGLEKELSEFVRRNLDFHRRRSSR